MARLPAHPAPAPAAERRVLRGPHVPSDPEARRRAGSVRTPAGHGAHRGALPRRVLRHRGHPRASPRDRRRRAPRRPGDLRCRLPGRSRGRGPRKVGGDRPIPALHPPPLEPPRVEARVRERVVRVLRCPDCARGAGGDSVPPHVSPAPRGEDRPGHLHRDDGLPRMGPCGDRRPVRPDGGRGPADPSLRGPRPEGLAPADREGLLDR